MMCAREACLTTRAASGHERFKAISLSMAAAAVHRGQVGFPCSTKLSSAVVQAACLGDHQLVRRPLPQRRADERRGRGRQALS